MVSLKGGLWVCKLTLTISGLIFRLFLGLTQINVCEKGVFCNTIIVVKGWSADEERWTMGM